MITKYKIFHSKSLYIFFLFLSLNIFFFSTTKVQGKAFDVNNIEISKPFEINFDKNKVIDEGFSSAFLKLISLITNSADQKKVSQTKLNRIKGMVETFSIQEEKFVDEIYYVNLGVSFNKKKVFNYLEEKNIFPSIPLEKKILFIPVIINESKKDLLLFSDNKIFQNWNENPENIHLIQYILPTEDLEDINLIKEKFESIEKYDFKEIIKKYDLEDSIVALIFKDKKQVRVLSRIDILGNTVLKNKTFPDNNIKSKEQVKNIVNDLKLVYEDHWKKLNQINTSIKLILNIKTSNLDSEKILGFEKFLNQTDLIYDYYISKFDKNFVYYQIIFNGTPDNFLKSMKNENYNFNTQNKIWILK